MQDDHGSAGGWHKATKTGAQIGAVLGLAFGTAVLADNSPLGFYNGNVFLVLAGWTLAGAAAGAAIGWAIADSL